MNEEGRKEEGRKEGVGRVSSVEWVNLGEVEAVTGGSSSSS